MPKGAKPAPASALDGNGYTAAKEPLQAWQMMPQHQLQGIQSGVPWAKGSLLEDGDIAKRRAEARVLAVANAAAMSSAAEDTNFYSPPTALPHGAYWNRQYQGNIRSFNKQKGFGFIDCQDTLQMFGRDVFVHNNQMAESGLVVGQAVLFEVELSKAGQPQARRLQPYVSPDDLSAVWASYAMGQRPKSMSGNSCMGGGCMPLGQAGSSSSSGAGAAQRRSGPQGTPASATALRGPLGSAAAEARSFEPIEEMLWNATGPAMMWEIIEQHGHLFGKAHVTIALYQIGLCRQYQHGGRHVSLTSALVDRLVIFNPCELTIDEASRVLWALTQLEEVRDHKKSHDFAMQLGVEAAKRLDDFNPSQMAKFVTSLARLTKEPGEDDVVGQLIESFSDHALGSGRMPRFPPDEMRAWTDFLQSLSGGPGRIPR